MNLKQLPRDLQSEYLQHLDYPEIVTLCQSDRSFRALCSSLSTLIAEKKKSAIPFSPSHKSILTFTTIYKPLSFAIDVPRRGTVIAQDESLWVVTEVELTPHLPNHRGFAIIYPVRRIVKGYAIIDPHDIPEKIELKATGVFYYAWVNSRDQPINFN